MYINGITFVPSGERVSSVVLQLCHTLSVHFNHLLSQDLLWFVPHVELPSATHAGLSLLHHQQCLRVPPLRNTFARHSHTVKSLYLTVIFSLLLAHQTFYPKAVTKGIHLLFFAPPICI